MEKSDTQKLLDAYSMFEEENVLPRPRTLRYLSNVLEGRGEKVPFVVPQLINEKNKPNNQKEGELVKDNFVLNYFKALC